MSEGKPSWRRIIIEALICGGVYGLAFEPGIGFGLMGRVLILLSVLRFLALLSGVTTRQARLAGFAFGFASFALGTSWLWHIFGAASVVLWLYLALFPMAFAGAWVWVSQRCLEYKWWSFVGPVIAGSLWASLEYLRGECVWLEFPWMTIAHGIGPGWLISIVGVYGFAFVFVTAAIPIKRQGFSLQWGGPCGILIYLSFLSVHGVWMAEVEAPKASTIKVAALQGEGMMFEGYAAMTKNLALPAELIVWPEYALPFDVMKSKRDSAALLALAKERNATLVVGTQTTGDGNAWWNTALTLDANGERGRHFKKHTVHFFDDGTPGLTALPVALPLGQMGTPICFDNDHQDVVREMTLAGAEFFAVPSMDPADWGVKQHLQHAELFRLRAAENGRWMVVASSSGVTQLIDPYGYVHSRLEPLTRGALTGEIVALKELTFFTQYGWRFSWLCVGASILAIGFALTRPQPTAHKALTQGSAG